MTATCLSSQVAPASASTPAEEGNGVPAAEAATAQALNLRDQALAALDRGDARTALATAQSGLVALRCAGLGGLDEAALLIAVAEIEEARGRLDAARVTIAAAITILEIEDIAPESAEDTAALWCQAQERLAGLERQAGEYATAVARLGRDLAGVDLNGAIDQPAGPVIVRFARSEHA